MRAECKHYETRMYASGETVRKCSLDLAPDAPWRCPNPCPGYERRLADVAWEHGSLITPPTPAEPPGLDDGSAAALLDEAEDIVNAVMPEALHEVQSEEPFDPSDNQGVGRWLRRFGKRRGPDPEQ